jgi:hypothetical protein
MEGTDAAVGDAAVALAELVADVGGGEDGFIDVAELGFVEPILDAALALVELSSYLGVHSKLPFRQSDGESLLHQTSRKSQEFRVFSEFTSRRTPGASLVQGLDTLAS